MAKYSYWLTDEGLVRIKGYARDGLVDAEIAKKMCISRSTLAVWRKKFPAINDVLKETKEVVDRQVEMSLFDRAVGQTVKLRKPFKMKKINYDPTTGKKISEEEYIDYGEVEEYIPADTKAITFWLINRKPNEWKQKIEVETTEENDTTGLIQIGSVEKMDIREVIDGEYKETESAGSKDGEESTKTATEHYLDTAAETGTVYEPSGV